MSIQNPSMTVIGSIQEDAFGEGVVIYDSANGDAWIAAEPVAVTP